MNNASDGSPLPQNLLRALFHPWTWRMAWRDSRTQRRRLAMFSLSMVAGVAALVAIHSLKASMERGIGQQAKALLGSDLMISSRQTLSAEIRDRVGSFAEEISREISFASMLSIPLTGDARLVQVRGIEGGYPFYGTVQTDPPGAWTQLQREGGVLLEPGLMEQFGLKTGGVVQLGRAAFSIRGVVNKPPPRSSRFSGFAPEAYVRLADLEPTGLLGGTMLAFHQVHLRLPGDNAAEVLKSRIRREFPDAPWRLETPEDRRETLGDALDNMQQFLGIIGLAALVLGAIGVAGAVHAHVSRRVPVVAILRCMGCPGAAAFAVFLAQAIALGVAGCVVGAALGMVLHAGILAVYRDVLPVSLEAGPVWAVVIKTAAAGFAVCCGFALMPLLRIWRISPAAALRDDLAPGGQVAPIRQTWLVYAALALILAFLAGGTGDGWRRAGGLVLGLGIAFGALAGVAKALIWMARRVVSPAWPYVIRQGISNLQRPHNQTLLFLLSLGLGTFLMVTILFTRNLLLERIKIRDFADSPNVYLVDVQPDQLDGVKSLVGSLKLPVLESAPMVTMRIESIRGVSVADLQNQGRIPRWVLRREFRSTYRPEMKSTETLMAGEWIEREHSGDGAAALSLEEEMAKDLGVGVGDELVLDVQGVSIPARVANLRKVDWSRFNLNFFMVFPPGVLEGAPGFHVITTRVPEGMSSGELQRELVKNYPTVSAIDLSLILETVRTMLEKISRVVSLLAAFTVLAGVPILAGTLLNGRDQRVRESVLLRTLGASSRQVRTILLVEYSVLGTLSAVAGLILAAGAHVALAHFVFKAPAEMGYGVMLGAVLAGASLAVVSGALVSRGVSRHPPLAILRQQA
jgi:putative ABC transport system permease protein